MAKVIVVTNFSYSSRNALDYACRFLHNPETTVLLLNIFSFPGSITYNPIAIAAMGETIADDERKLQEEYEWVRSNYPEINIHFEMVTGVFLEELYTKATEEEAVLIVMGADGNYTELLSWNTNIIDAFVDLNIPVLVIPAQVQYQPVEKIAFAVNYYRKNLHAPVAMVKRLVQFTQAKLYVINVISPAEIIDEEAKESKRILKENLKEVSPVYYEPEFKNIFSAIDNFSAAENINMMLVIPSRHGLWYNIFNQNYTKGLVNLNHIPVLSLRQQKDFI
ncbi:MAG: universal stress protein [Parafilimonas sp.]